MSVERVIADAVDVRSRPGMSMQARQTKGSDDVRPDTDHKGGRDGGAHGGRCASDRRRDLRLGERARPKRRSKAPPVAVDRDNVRQGDQKAPDSGTASEQSKNRPRMRRPASRRANRARKSSPTTAPAATRTNRPTRTPTTSSKVSSRRRHDVGPAGNRRPEASANVPQPLAEGRM